MYKMNKTLYLIVKVTSLGEGQNEYSELAK